MKKKSLFHVFIIFGSISLTAQIILCMILFYNETPDDHTVHFFEDALSVSNITIEIGCPIFIVNSGLLENYISGQTSKQFQCISCSVNENRVVFAAQYSCLRKIGVLINLLEQEHFATTVFHNRKILQIPPHESTVPVAIGLKRNFPFIIMLLHSREDNFWWHGALHSDPKAQLKLASLGLTLKQAVAMESEGALWKVRLQTITLSGNNFVAPQNATKFLHLSASHSKKFIECDYRRADMFFSTHGRDTSRGAIRFQHQAWKLLSRVKTLLDQLNVSFWLSSGTCLGFHRQCDFIPYSRDVDIGIMARDFSEHMVAEFVSHNFALKHVFGKPSDSWELSFMSNGVKLDIFFFYEEKDKGIIWNGGTQARTGRKFKYIFPHFTLCWTEFLELLVRVPCDTETYIEANYGPDWFTPRIKWDWKSSPPNVQENGVWPEDEKASAIQVFSIPS